MILNSTSVSRGVSTTNGDFGISLTIMRTHVEGKDILGDSLLFHNAVENGVSVVSSHRGESQTNNTIEMGLSEDITSLFMDFNESLVVNLNTSKINGISGQFTQQFTGTELDVEGETHGVVIGGVSEIILFATQATGVITMNGVDPDVGRPGIIDDIEGVIGVTN